MRSVALTVARTRAASGRAVVLACGLSAFPALATAQSVRLNGPLAHGGSSYGAEDVLGFQLAPDGSWAVFFADTELEDNRFELFGVPVDGSAAPRRLNGPLVAGGNLVQVYEDPFLLDFDPVTLAISPGNVVVYRADQDIDEVYELFAAPIDGSTAPVRISGTMVAGGDVQAPFRLAPDGSRVVFAADRETDGLVELWSAPLDASAAPVRLGPATLGSVYPNGEPFAITPDSARVVFLLDQSGASVFELWSAPLDGSAAATRLSAGLVAGGDVLDFSISPDGTRVLYRADQAVDERTELWLVPTDGSAAPLRVNANLIAQGDVDSYSFSPDGARAVYRADQEVDEARRLYAATLDPAPAVVALGPAAVAGRSVFDAEISPDSTRVVFRGDVLTDGIAEVFSVPIDASAPAVRLNQTLPPGAILGSARIAPVGARVVYRADQLQGGVFELFSVPIEGGVAPVRLNADLATGGDVEEPFGFSPDGSRVLFRADQRADGRVELWSAPLDGGAPPVRMNAHLVEGGGVQAPSPIGLDIGFEVAADGTRVVYRADQDTNDLFSLWSVPLDRSQPPRELSTTLDPGPVLGDVRSFAWSPDGTHLLYTADESLDEVVQVRALALERRTLLERSGPHPSLVLGNGTVLATSPDSMLVAFRGTPSCLPVPYCAPSASLHTATIDGSTPSVFLDTGMAGYAGPFTFSPDGTRIVFRQIINGFHVFEGGLFTMPADGSLAPVSLTDPPGLNPAFPGRFEASPDGTRVVYWSQSSTGPLWSVPIDRSSEPVALVGPVFPRAVLDTFRISADGAWVVFVGDLRTEGVFELFRVPIDGGLAPEPLGPLPAPFADVDPAFRLEGERVLFVADLEVDGPRGLWSLALDPPGAAPLRLSAAPAPGRSVAGALGFAQDRPQFELDPVSGRVVYLSAPAHVRTASGVPGPVGLELLSVPADASSAPVRLSAAGQSVLAGGFHLDPLGARVVWAATDPGGVLRLHAAPIDGSAPAIPLGGPFADGGSLWLHPQDGAAPAFALTPDGAAVVYVADQRTDGVLELFVVPTDGSQPARALNGSLVAGGDVAAPAGAPSRTPFALSPDGKLVAYLADQEQDEVYELFAAALEPPVKPVRPSGTPIVR